MDHDQADVDALDSLLLSPGWELVSKQLDAAIESERIGLERDDNEIDTARTRGKLAGLRMAQRLPRNMRDLWVAQLRNT